MSEVLFYHLERLPLEAALPSLLERCHERRWRTVVQTATDERRDALDQHLWTYRDDSFLPHAISTDPDVAAQPIVITSGPDNPNGSTVRFYVDRAEPADLAAYERVVFLFDGNDPEALADARRHWKSVKSDGHQPTYWQQDGNGRWVKKA